MSEAVVTLPVPVTGMALNIPPPTPAIAVPCSYPVSHTSPLEAAATGPLGALIDDCQPPALWMRTSDRMRLPMSAGLAGVYVDVVSPGMSTHRLPAVSHRSHRTSLAVTAPV